MSPDGDGPAFAILTRFNLPSEGFESVVRGADDWLVKRVDLFERFCLPSVIAQTDQDFVWIVYFDPNSPVWLKGKIEFWQHYDRFHPVFRSRVSLAEKQCDIASRLAPRPRLITANLDNDDGLASDFVARLKWAPITTPRCAVTIGQGLILAGDRLYRHQDRHNAFCAVSESWHNPHTCWSHPHTLLAQAMPSVILGGPPGWLQVVHGDNVSNRVKGRRVAPGPFKARFGALDGATDPAFWELACEAFALPARAVSEALRSLAKLLILRALGPWGVDRAKAMLRRWAIR